MPHRSWLLRAAGVAAGVALVFGLTRPIIASAGPREDRAAAPGTIRTIAGGPGGPARATGVALYRPCALTYANGFLYETDGGPLGDQQIRKISTKTDQLVTVAEPVAAIQDGAPDNAIGGRVCGVAVDHSGNVLFSEEFHQAFGIPGGDVIQVVAAKTGTFYGQPMLAGHRYTIAGTGEPGDGGDGGPAVKAQLSGPSGLAVDAAGNVIVADDHNERIRVVAEASGTFYGVPMTAGDIYTVAGGGPDGYDNGGAAVDAGLLISGADVGVRVDHSGNLVFSDVGDRVVRVVAATSGTFYGMAMQAGHIYTVAGIPDPPPHPGCGNTGGGGPALQARFCPRNVAVDHAGNLVIGGAGWVWVDAVKSGTFYGRRMSAGHIYRVLRIGSPYDSPLGVSVDGAGNVVVSNGYGGSVGAIDVLAGRAGTDFGLTMRPGHLYKVAGDGWPSFSGDGGPATSAEFGTLVTDRSGSYGVAGLAVDQRGNVVIADVNNLRLRVLARKTGRFYGQQMVAGDIYTIAGNGRKGSSKRRSGPASGTEIVPTGVSADKSGDLAISGPIGGTGEVWLLPARSGELFGRHVIAGDAYIIGQCPADGCDPPEQTAFDASGNLIINLTSDIKLGVRDHQDHVFVLAARNGTFYGRSMTAGHMYVLAGDGPPGDSGDGGLAVDAEVATGPVAVDQHGNVLLGQDGSIRVIAASSGTFYGRAMTAGHIYTVATNCCGTLQFSPWQIVVDGSGNVLMTDPNQDVVKVLAESSGNFYGVPMVAGQLYTIAGTGAEGFSGDGGPAVQAELGGPGALTVTPTGDVLVGDLMRIREISG